MRTFVNALQLGLAVIAIGVLVGVVFISPYSASVQAQNISTVTSAADITGTGAAVALQASSTRARWVQIVCLTGNSAVVRVGDSSVTASRGIAVAAGSGFMFPIQQSTNQYYDVSTLYAYIGSNDKVTIIWGL